MFKTEKSQELPMESGNYTCLLENGQVIESEFVRLENLGIAYFKNVVNTGHFVVAWKPAQ